ncbi:hypothetical protein [Acidipropionibacterium jensenii]|uniref:hypothetical protein n=1 Tax=Acidipropionibacterium jensenii TaxID=1749 RepID=UPI00214BF6DE|nr:hypothetical protein [Acidipropionibacterium jensenii]
MSTMSTRSENAGRRASVTLFKPSGTFQTEASWRVPSNARGPYDMEHSPDFARVDGTGAVLVEAEAQHEGDENWGFPHLIVEIDQH